MDLKDSIKTNKKTITPKFYLELPSTPGVYIYWDLEKPIYVGKAISLKNRVSSYFRLNLETKTQKMINEAKYISHISVTGEFEALLLEAKLIKKLKPKYNIISKDDRNPLYIIITKDEFPRVTTARRDGDFGPFLSAQFAFGVLRMIRKIVPFSDHKLGKKPCLYSHLGLCDPCPNVIPGSSNYIELRKQYLRNIRRVKEILNGRFSKIKHDLEIEMNTYSKNEQFEEAKIVRDKLRKFEFLINNKIDVSEFLENPNLSFDIKRKEQKALLSIVNKFFPSLKSVKRIECFDIAHFSGDATTASMVTFVDGSPEKGLYRNFRVNSVKKANDYGSMNEIGERRRNNLEKWGKPDLIIVDGSIGQINSFKKGLNSEIPVVGIAKHPDRLVYDVENKVRLQKEALYLVQKMRDEAHRFARRYHHKLLKLKYVSIKS